MSFEGQYLTYAEYVSLGGTLQETPFNIAEFLTRREIDLRTLNRLIGVDEIPNEVKLCEYNLIDFINKYQTENKNGNIQSESVGDYSVTYASDFKEIIKGKNEEIEDIILSSLYGVIVNGEHLIYIGVN